jgi:FAD/FMN-containing dehydrogenase/Fe-S oxidoreductase
MSSISDHDVDVVSLARALKYRIEGEVRFDEGSRALYATDASNYRQVPLGVVVPRTAEDVCAAIDVCRDHGAPIVNRGGGTSLSGQTCNVAVVIDMSKHLNRITWLDADRRVAQVEPGVVLDDVRDAAEKFGLTFGPDPATHNRCTLGGMIGNNSCGVHSVMSGKTDANIEALDVLTYRGERFTVTCRDEAALPANPTQSRIYQQLKGLRDEYRSDIQTGLVDIPRRVSGFGLPHLLPENRFNVAASLVGTEGTCVTVLGATLKLVSSPPVRSLVVLGFEDIFVAADAVPDIVRFNPIGLEGMDDRMVADMRHRRIHLEDLDLLPPGKGWLFAEFGADAAEKARADVKSFTNAMRRLSVGPSIRVCSSKDEAKRIWEMRESGLGAGALVEGKFLRWPGWDDSAVAPEKMGAYLRALQQLMDRHGYDGAFYGHFGQGCLHVRYNFDFSSAQGISAFRSFIEEATDLVVGFGGSLSGEHGDGQSHGELLGRMYRPRLMEAFRRFKEIWDPDWKMNPGKVLEARPMDSDLRLADFHPPPLKTKFAYPADGGSFTMAALRCVGVGKCRRHDGGTMCPSYMATHEEMHSTRGRARMLFEMLQGDRIDHGWRDKRVKEALDLCLACKACKSECPVSVDMASYKAEFLSHYYRRRIRPRSAYAMGLIGWWAPTASKMPRIVNGIQQLPVLGRLAKAAAGVAPQRDIPRFAGKTFRSMRRDRPADPPGSLPRVVLWTDTFTNHFEPDIAVSAKHVLQSAGFDVVVPATQTCCGRPLYDFGMLDLARHQLKQILRQLHTEIMRGTPFIVLEPSCASVFREELPQLFPKSEVAARLRSQTGDFADFLVDRVPEEWTGKGQRVVVHGHCHQKSGPGMSGEMRLLQKLGFEASLLDAGCCGMAGAFGFEADHYDVSVACAQRVLVPAVQALDDGELLVADGFSCREQVRQLTGRTPLHLAQILESVAAA